MHPGHSLHASGTTPTPPWEPVWHMRWGWAVCLGHTVSRVCIKSLCRSISFEGDALDSLSRSNGKEEAHPLSQMTWVAEPCESQPHPGEAQEAPKVAILGSGACSGLHFPNWCSCRLSLSTVNCILGTVNPPTLQPRPWPQPCCWADNSFILVSPEPAQLSAGRGGPSLARALVLEPDSRRQRPQHGSFSLWMMETLLHSITACQRRFGHGGRKQKQPSPL